MAFSPNESSVDDFSLVEPLDFLEQERQKLFAVSITSNPWWSHVSIAETTEIDDGFFGDTDCNVSFGDGTGRTNVSNGGDKLNTAHWTQDGNISGFLDFHLDRFQTTKNEEVEIIISEFIIFTRRIVYKFKKR